MLRRAGAASCFAAAACLARLVAGSGDPDVTLYFGCGCFWHVQHEFIVAERSLLGRTDAELTAIVGYAGGLALNDVGKVCYPPTSQHGDAEHYHAEVVQVTMPRSKVPAVAAMYWSLFVGINRIDVQDVGPWYRAAIGVPGGMSSPVLAEIHAAQTGVVQQAFQLQAALSGGEADTLGQALVWVYDSDQFPFYQGEVYHQFHDDMVENYPDEYNDLRSAFLGDCRIVPTDCRYDGPARWFHLVGCPESLEYESEGLDTVDESAYSGGSGTLDPDATSSCHSGVYQLALFASAAAAAEAAFLIG